SPFGAKQMASTNGISSIIWIPHKRPFCTCIISRQRMSIVLHLPKHLQSLWDRLSCLISILPKLCALCLASNAFVIIAKNCLEGLAVSDTTNSLEQAQRMTALRLNKVLSTSDDLTQIHLKDITSLAEEVARILPAGNVVKMVFS